jgi:phospholipase/carboxylesterase
MRPFAASGCALAWLLDLSIRHTDLPSDRNICCAGGPSPDQTTCQARSGLASTGHRSQSGLTGSRPIDGPRDPIDPFDRRHLTQGLAMHPSLVIFLHGVRADGSQLAPLGDGWRTILPGAAFAAPDAPFEGPRGGRQWFSLDGVTRESRPQRLAAARPAFDALLESVVADHGLSGDLSRVALVGFSQGAMMALDALVSGRWPVAAVVAFSGRLASPPPLAPRPGAAVLLIHGADDPAIPCQESRDAAAALQQLGVKTQVRILPGVSHKVAPEGAALAGAFLAECLNRGVT